MKKTGFPAFVFIISILFLSAYLWGIAAAEPDGKAIYEKSCKMCHGIDGKGNPKVAKAIKVDLAKLNLTGKETSDKKDAELVKTVSDGSGKIMKGFKDKLKQEEIAAVIGHIRSLATQKPAN